MVESAKEGPLAALLKTGRLPLREKVRIVTALARAPGGEVEPSSVVLKDGAPELQPGLATARAFLYRSPEALANPTTDEPSRVYSLACLLYEAIEGKPPFEAKDVSALMKRIESEKPKAPRTDDFLASTVVKALSRDPTVRHATAALLADDLDLWMGGRRDVGKEARVASAPRVPAMRPRVEPETSNSAVLPAIAGVLVLLGVVFGLLIRGHRKPAHPPPPPPIATTGAVGSDAPSTGPTEAAWQRFSPVGSRSSLALPGTPKQSVAQLDLGDRKVDMPSFVCDEDDRLLVVTHAVLPRGIVRPDHADDDLGRLTQKFADNWKVRAKRAMTISFKGFPCSDFDGTMDAPGGGTMNVRGRVLVAYDVLHVLLAGTPDDPTELADRYFDSFQLEAR